MNAQQERYEAEQNRMQDLDHAVAEAEVATGQRPDDRSARTKLDMLVAIRAEAQKTLASAERAVDG